LQTNGTFNQSRGTVSLSEGALDIGVDVGNGTYNLTNSGVVTLDASTVYIDDFPQDIGALNVAGNSTFDLESIGSGGQLYVGDTQGRSALTQPWARHRVVWR